MWKLSNGKKFRSLNVVTSRWKTIQNPRLTYCKLIKCCIIFQWNPLYGHPLPRDSTTFLKMCLFFWLLVLVNLRSWTGAHLVQDIWLSEWALGFFSLNVTCSQDTLLLVPGRLFPVVFIFWVLLYLYCYIFIISTNMFLVWLMVHNTCALRFKTAHVQAITLTHLIPLFYERIESERMVLAGNFPLKTSCLK